MTMLTKDKIARELAETHHKNDDVKIRSVFDFLNEKEKENYLNMAAYILRLIAQARHETAQDMLSMLGGPNPPKEQQEYANKLFAVFTAQQDGEDNVPISKCCYAPMYDKNTCSKCGNSAAGKR